MLSTRSENNRLPRAVYRRRQPERSAVYQVVQGHLETWLAGCRNQDEEGSPVAAYIEQDFHKVPECGILVQAALLGQGAPIAVTISSLPAPVRVEQFVRPAIHGGSGGNSRTPG